MLERCPKCRVFVEEDAKVCPECGFAFVPIAQEPLKPKAPSFVGLPNFMRKEPAYVVKAWRRPPFPYFSLLGLLGVALVYHFQQGLFVNFSRLREAVYPSKRWKMAAAIRADRIKTIMEPKPALQQQRKTEVIVVKQSQIAVRPASSQWAFKGVVSDLITLKPVSLAQVVFEDMSQNKRFATSSAGDGSFRIELPAIAGEGYYIRADHTEYIGKPIIRDLSASAGEFLSQHTRHSLGREVARTIRPVEYFKPREAGVLELTIFLTPKNIGN